MVKVITKKNVHIILKHQLDQLEKIKKAPFLDCELGEVLEINEVNRTMVKSMNRVREIGEIYGKKKVGHILKSAARLGNLELVFKKQLGKNFKQLTEQWHDAVKNQVTPDTLLALQGPNDIAEQITKQQSFYHRINVTPAVSPDGSMVAFVSNQNLNDEIHILKKNDRNEYVSFGILKGGTSKRFESLHILDTSIGWSKVRTTVPSSDCSSPRAGV